MKTLPLLTLCGLVALTAPRANASALLKPTSGVTQALSAKSLSVETYLRGAFARTTVTTVYSNPNEDRIEADFLYSAPKGSVVTGFAYWYGKEKVVARVVEKGRAAKIYEYITSRMRDPALIEMVGKNTFRARIFPIEARNDLKIEIQLAQSLPQTKMGPLWTYPLRDETKGGALQEVDIRVHSQSSATSNMGAFKNGELHLVNRNFKAKDDLRALVAQKPAPIRASLLAARDGGTDGFFALSLTPTSPVAQPTLKINGIQTYEVVVPRVSRLAAGQAFVVTGRYRGSGRAVVALGNQSFDVVFPDEIEKNNIASALWAANRIDALSANPKNQKLVVELSKRFGVPSKWTSWLAIPEEERSRFKREMLAADLADAARAYAQATARLDPATAKSEQTRFESLKRQLKAEGGYYDENQPLSNYLNDELRRLQLAAVRARYEGKVSRSQQAQWKEWAKNLRKAGATDEGEGIELPVYAVTEAELRMATRLYLDEIEMGRVKSQRARSLRARLKQISKTQTAQDNGWEQNTFVDEAAYNRADTLAWDIATIRAADKVDRKRERQLMARLKRLDNGTSIEAGPILREALESVWGEKVEAAGRKWAWEIEAGRADSAAAKKFAKEVRALQKRSGLKHVYAVDAAWNSLASKTALRVAPTIHSQGPNGEAARRLNAQIDVITRRSGRPRAEIARQAWTQVGSTVAADLAKEIRNGQGDGAKAKQLETQLSAMEKRYKIDYPYEVRSAWQEVEQGIATELAEEIKAKREEEPKAKQLEIRLAEVSKRANSTSSWITNQAWQNRAMNTYVEKLKETLEHGQETPRAQELKQESEKLALKAHSSKQSLEQEAAYKLLQDFNTTIGEEIAAKRENGDKIQKARSLRQKLLDSTPTFKSNYQKTSFDYIERFAWEGRAHESAYRLLEAQKSGNNKQAESLQQEFDLAVRKGAKNRDDVLAWEKGRLDMDQPLITATDYRLRPGDPLISVLAPADCRQVLAVMPDGTLLPLRYDEQKGAWEARFDVPAGAAQGDYKVQILIVAADGSRKRLVMNFAVDTQAPTGSASLKQDDRHWNLRLEADEQTDRVSAFLPWNERVELRRDVEGVFTAQVAVPQEAMGKAKVRFILTDKAHNRTELFIDWE